jgi:hypothetical protein
MHQWAKAGLMIRETLNPDSRHFSLFMTKAGNPSQILWRSATAGITSDYNIQNLDRQLTFRISKTGNQFRAYIKNMTDQVWVQSGDSVTIDFQSANYFLGLAVNSHDTSKVETATIDVPDVVFY